MRRVNYYDELAFLLLRASRSSIHGGTASWGQDDASLMQLQRGGYGASISISWSVDSGAVQRGEEIGFTITALKTKTHAEHEECRFWR